MPNQYHSIWGLPTMLTHDTNLMLTVSAQGNGDVCSLLFSDAICDMLPADPRLMRHWLFTLHEPFQPTIGSPATVEYQLRLYVYKPADAEVRIKLSSNGQSEELYYAVGQLQNGNVTLVLQAPFDPAAAGFDMRLDVQVRRTRATDQVTVSFDSVDVVLQ